MFAPSWVGAFGLVTAALAWGLALLVLRAGAGRDANRRLALLLVAEGMIAGAGTGLLYLTDEAGLARGAQVAAVAAMFAVPFLNLRLLGLLETPLAAPWRLRGVPTALVVAALVAAVVVLARPDAFVGDVIDVWYARYDVVPADGFYVAFGAMTLVNLYAFVASLHARRVSPLGPRRDRASAFLLAFGLRDVLVVLAFVVDAAFGPRALALVLGPPLILLVYVPLIAYGILRAQVFDIDLRLQRGLQHTTVAAVFLVVFFVVSETIEALTSTRWGPVVGLVAAALLALVGDRLQRLAGRLSALAMPGVEDTPRYREERRAAVYRAAVADALQNGSISERERRVLGHLRDALGLAEADAARIERESAAA